MWHSVKEKKKLSKQPNQDPKRILTGWAKINQDEVWTWVEKTNDQVKLIDHRFLEPKVTQTQGFKVQ